MAKDHLQGEQLEMFMPAHKLMSMTSGDATFDKKGNRLALGDDDEMHRTKLFESKHGDMRDARSVSNDQRFTLFSSIKKHGVTTPVKVGWTHSGEHHIWDGNHRIASANHINPETEVPIQYTMMKDWIS